VSISALRLCGKNLITQGKLHKRPVKFGRAALSGPGCGRRYWVQTRLTSAEQITVRCGRWVSFRCILILSRSLGLRFRATISRSSPQIFALYKVQTMGNPLGLHKREYETESSFCFVFPVG